MLLQVSAIILESEVCGLSVLNAVLVFFESQKNSAFIESISI